MFKDDPKSKKKEKKKEQSQWQKWETENPWKWVKHAKLYSDILRVLEKDRIINERTTANYGGMGHSVKDMQAAGRGESGSLCTGMAGHNTPDLSGCHLKQS